MTVPYDLDGLDGPSFSAAVGPLFEQAPRFLDRLDAARPFGSWPALFSRAREIAAEMPEAEQIELIDAHPRLGASPASVSAMSFREQGYDRGSADDPDPELAGAEFADPELARLNEAYESAFGFRYCVFVAGRPRAELLPAFRAALSADRASELRRALGAVIDIAADRQGRSSS